MPNKLATQVLAAWVCNYGMYKNKDLTLASSGTENCISFLLLIIFYVHVYGMLCHVLKAERVILSWVQRELDYSNRALYPCPAEIS